MRVERLDAEPAVATVRGALEGSGAAWIVGGTLRDALLGRELRDLDLAVEGDPRAAARAVAAAAGGPVFPLSETFGAWRALSADGSWHCDISPLQGPTIEADLAQRDFSINAMASPLAGGELIDLHGGMSDLSAGLLRVLGPEAYAADPLRALRLVRLASELGLAVERETETITRAAAPRIEEASGERVFAELRGVIVSGRAVAGLRLAGRLGITAAVLPEFAALEGVEQSDFHDLDAHEHTLAVLERQIELEADPGRLFGEAGAPLAAVLAEPFADQLTRAEALRFGALFHDLGKPETKGVRGDGRITFIGHDDVGERIVTEICNRLRTSDRLRSLLGALTRHHLRLGFLVHEAPLSRAAIYRYLLGCSPVEVEVTALSCADRLGTQGRNAERAIAAHLELAAQMMVEAIAWRAAGGAPKPPLRGDELASALGIERGPELGKLLARVREGVFTGEVSSSDDAIELARALRHNRAP